MKFRTAILMAAFVAVAVLVAPAARSEDGGIPQMRKLGRGISNVAFGALEVLIRAYDVNQEEGGIASVTYGVLDGVCMCVAREVVGVVEIVTFMIPLPGATIDTHESGWGYGPLMKPEFVLDKRHDFYNVVFQDLPAE